MPQATKALFLASLDCPGMAWLMRTSGDDTALSEAAKLRMDEGREIGRLARDAMPGGTFVAPDAESSAVERTKAIVDERAVDVLYEAAFEWNGLVAKPDVLRRESDGWCVVEVKSATRDDKKYIKDLAYTFMVARGAGVPVSRGTLMLLSKEYRLGMGPSELFVEVDHTDDVEALLPEFVASWKETADAVMGDTRPQPEFTFACGKCGYYTSTCIGEGIEDPLFDLPRLSRTKFEKLRDIGVNCVAEIPPDFKLTESQDRVRQASVSGQAWQSSELDRALRGLEWPAFYLDFETTKTALPLFPDVAPQQQIPTQYSIHVYADIETELRHRWFLADHRVDDRRRLAQSLLKDLQGSGSIVVYSPFEKRVMSDLAQLYPDLADSLNGCIGRLLDLERIIKDHYYHPGFHGRTSIKQTLPTLVNDESYEGLDIRNGDDASALFARMARGERSEAECAKICSDLLRYCRQDTKAMVKVHKALWEIVN